MTFTRVNARPPSKAQLEVLAQYVEGGLTVAELAAARRVSTGTVEQQLAQCRRRLDAVTSAQAYAIAVRTGLIGTTKRLN